MEQSFHASKKEFRIKWIRCLQKRKQILQRSNAIIQKINYFCSCERLWKEEKKNEMKMKKYGMKKRPYKSNNYKKKIFVYLLSSVFVSSFFLNLIKKSTAKQNKLKKMYIILCMCTHGRRFFSIFGDAWKIHNLKGIFPVFFNTGFLPNKLKVFVLLVGPIKNL